METRPRLSVGRASRPAEPSAARLLICNVTSIGYGGFQPCPWSPTKIIFLFQAQGIRKQYGGVQALRGVHFDLRPGEVHALVGENGAGKSTLIKIMTGAVLPDSGTLVVGGR